MRYVETYNGFQVYVVCHVYRMTDGIYCDLYFANGELHAKLITLSGVDLLDLESDLKEISR